MSAAIGLMILLLMAYAAFLTSAWGTLLGCAPAIVVMTAVIAGHACGTFLFEREEDETPEEAGRLDGTAIFDWIGGKIANAVHRASIQLHVHGVGR